MFDNINSLLIDYVKSTEDPEINYKLGRAYYQAGQTAAAISYFLRCSERTLDGNLAYECLILIGKCFDKQGNRNYTVKAAYREAMILKPKRPEAYYLMSLKFEAEKNFSESYLMAELGIVFGDDNEIPFTENHESLGYMGRWALYFQKAVTAWWVGKGMESRRLFQMIANTMWDVIDEYHKSLVQKNIVSLGSGPEEYAFRMYDKSKYGKLRYKFDGAETIDRNYSQICQDMFVLSMLNGKRNGSFLEIGGADPWKGNNTALLEQKFGWKGISIEYDEKFVTNYRLARPNVTQLHQDALQINYEELLSKNFIGNTIDYLQLDIEPAVNTYDCMLKIPFDKYKFAVITYEHDYCADVTKKYRELSREFLKSKGYVLVANDLSPDGIWTFEDWWVHPDLIDPAIIKKMQSVTDHVQAIEDYLYLAEEPKYYEYSKCDKYIREQFFPNKDQGVMVEVGAGPPEFLSMSKHFRDSGWRAICVEPNPKFLEQHKNLGHEIYDYACSNDEGISEFTINLSNDQNYTQENDGVSFSALGIRFDDVPSHNIQEKIEVKKIRLNTLLEQLNVEKIDLLTIDVEGWEKEVLEGFNADKYQPKVIMIENRFADPFFKSYMNQIGYKLNTIINENEIYVKAEKVNMFAINKSFNKRAFIVDNFYSDPMSVRKFAQQQEFFDGGLGRGFIGRRTVNQYLFDGLKESFEDIMGKRITKWQEYGMNGRFQLNIAGEPIVWHCDDQDFAAMIYLTPNAPASTGTSTFRSRLNGVFHKTEANLIGAFHPKTRLDGTCYEKVDQFGNLFNRLVIFDAGCIHAANEYFGADMDDARLWHMFFFDAV